MMIGTSGRRSRSSAPLRSRFYNADFGVANMSADTNFGSWAVAESPLTIEYSLVVIEEIRHVVTEGFQRLSRGGLECLG